MNNERAWTGRIAGTMRVCFLKKSADPCTQNRFFDIHTGESSQKQRREASPTNDRQLISALARDDTDALARIMDKYAAYAATVIHNQLGAFAAREDTEELTANVFTALWNHRKRLKTTHLRGWLAATARNEARRHLREKKLLTVSQEDVVLVSGDLAERFAEERERTRFVRELILALGYPDREIFLRYYYYDQKLSEIAAELDMNPETVKSRLRRGREKLKTMLEEADFHD